MKLAPLQLHYLIQIVCHGLTTDCFLNRKVWIQSRSVDDYLRHCNFKHDVGVRSQLRFSMLPSGVSKGEITSQERISRQSAIVNPT